MSREIKDFQIEVIERSYNKPVVVDFWAEWCGPCRILGPILERLAEQNNGEWELMKLDTDKNPELSVRYSIRGIPNVKLFIDGKVADEFTGAMPEGAIKAWLQKAIPDKYQKEIEKAIILINDNKEKEAEQILESILKRDPANGTASLFLAKLKVFSDPPAASLILNKLGDMTENRELYEALIIITSLVTREELPDNGNTREIYKQGIINLKQKNFEKALENFIQVIKENRNYDGDGARKACIAIFKYLGEDHQVTVKYRREFSSALYI